MSTLLRVLPYFKEQVERTPYDLQQEFVGDRVKVLPEHCSLLEQPCECAVEGVSEASDHK